MVQEVRRIMLDKQEMIAALEAYTRMKPEFLPGPKVLDLAPIDGTTITLSVMGASGEPVAVSLDEKQIILPLIRYCLENNIMLPRAGIKSVFVGKDTVSLCVSLNLNAEFVDPPQKAAQVAFGSAAH